MLVTISQTASHDEILEKAISNIDSQHGSGSFRVLIISSAIHLLLVEAFIGKQQMKEQPVVKSGQTIILWTLMRMNSQNYKMQS